jgi:hypothetical protein
MHVIGKVGEAHQVHNNESELEAFFIKSTKVART